MPSSSDFSTQDTGYHAEKVGHPPGSVVFTGEDRDHSVQFSVIDYTEDTLNTRETDDVADVLSYFSAPTTTWINVDGIHEESVIKTIGNHLGIHPLVQEDIANPAQRPKVETHDEHLYLTAKMISFADASTAAMPHDTLSTPEERVLMAEHISIVLGPDYLLSFQETPGDFFDPVRERLRSGRGRIRRAGPDYLAYALLDLIVDHYFLVLDTLGTDAEDLEDEILEDPQSDTQERVNALRRDLIFMRRRTAPVKELLAQLVRLDSPLWQESTHPFVRDTYDHAQQVVDQVESLRDTAGSLLDLHMSTLSHRMNEIMKVLTIIGTIFIPLTFIAGIYGMNFEYMPELQWDHGYFVSLGVMGALAVVTLAYFRRKEWI